MSGLLRSAVKASFALSCLALLSPIPATAASGVVEVIQKKYLLTEFSTDHNQVTKDGTTMALKTAGIYSLPASLPPPDNSVVDGKIKSANFVQKSFLEKFGAHVLQTGDKVYVTKIESKGDVKGDAIRFVIQSADSFDVTGQSTQQKFTASVSFHFKKGYLDEASPDEVEQAIEAIMSPDSGSDQAQGGGDSQGTGGQAPQQAPSRPRPAAPAPQQQAVAPQPQAAPAPAVPPPTISIGESSTQVLQAMGMPQQMIDLGKKKTFVYKNMKVIFTDDKVSDIQ